MGQSASGGRRWWKRRPQQEQLSAQYPHVDAGAKAKALRRLSSKQPLMLSPSRRNNHGGQQRFTFDAEPADRWSGREHAVGQTVGRAAEQGQRRARAHGRDGVTRGAWLASSQLARRFTMEASASAERVVHA
jgi:hypothetical protein